MYWKIIWLPFIHSSMLKIVPLVVRVNSASFVKCLDINFSILFILNQSVQLQIEEKITIFYCFKFILQNFKLLLLTGLSELWLLNGYITLLHRVFICFRGGRTEIWRWWSKDLYLYLRSHVLRYDWKQGQMQHEVDLFKISKWKGNFFICYLTFTLLTKGD